jgi:aminoglycoside 6'-N-acetyltransferase
LRDRRAFHKSDNPRVTELRGDEISLRPIGPDDVDAVRAIRELPEVAEWWGRVEDDFPLADDPDSTRFAIIVDGAVAGMIQYGEENDPDYRYASIDIFLDPSLRGRGLGTDALRRLVRHLIDDRGHHRITIDPDVDNVPAIRSYEKAGFRPVGVMRSAWRDPTGSWRDVLLMELVERGAR